MIALFKNRFVYLSSSLVLLVVAFPLISIGTSRGLTALWWIGLLALGLGALIPPLQRLLLGPAPAAVDPASTHDEAEPSESKGSTP